MYLSTCCISEITDYNSIEFIIGMQCIECWTNLDSASVGHVWQLLYMALKLKVMNFLEQKLVINLLKVIMWHKTVVSLRLYMFVKAG